MLFLFVWQSQVLFHRSFFIEWFVVLSYFTSLFPHFLPSVQILFSGLFVSSFHQSRWSLCVHIHKTTFQNSHFLSFYKFHYHLPFFISLLDSQPHRLLFISLVSFTNMSRRSAAIITLLFSDMLCIMSFSSLQKFSFSSKLHPRCGAYPTIIFTISSSTSIFYFENFVRHPLYFQQILN